MASRSVEITKKEMDEFFQVGENGKPMGEKRFYRMDLPNTFEYVYGVKLQKDISLRVYSSIDVRMNISREIGKDAIRVVLFWKSPENEIKLIGSEKKVLRTINWRNNLNDRILNWTNMLGESCPICKCHTVLRKGKYGKFYSCVKYPNCKGTVNLREENDKTSKTT